MRRQKSGYVQRFWCTLKTRRLQLRRQLVDLGLLICEHQDVASINKAW